jgi:transcriptional regulator with XRE-family HTH domain
MDENKIDVKEMATAADISTSYLYNILSDRISNPSINTLKLIARKLDVSLDYLEDGIDEEKVYLDEPNIFNHLPRDLQEFITKEENTPYLILAKQLSHYDPNKITETDIQFLVGYIRTILLNNKNYF